MLTAAAVFRRTKQHENWTVRIWNIQKDTRKRTLSPNPAEPEPEPKRKKYGAPNLQTEACKVDPEVTRRACVSCWQIAHVDNRSATTAHHACRFINFRLLETPDPGSPESFKSVQPVDGKVWFENLNFSLTHSKQICNIVKVSNTLVNQFFFDYFLTSLKEFTSRTLSPLLADELCHLQATGALSRPMLSDAECLCGNFLHPLPCQDLTFT